MSPDKRRLALLLAAALAIGCNAESDASKDSTGGAEGAGASLAAVTLATLTPQATLPRPSPSPGPTRTPLPPTQTPPPPPTATRTATPTTTPTPTPSPTPTSTPTPTVTPTSTSTPTPSPTPTPIVVAGITLSPQEHQLFAAHNQLRAAQGVAPLDLHPVLVDVARERAQTMADSGVFSHYAPNGDTVFDLLADAGYGYDDATENTHFNNVASGAVAFAMNEYRKSAPHLANILDPGFLRAGFGFVTSASGVHYVVVVFSD